MGHSRFSKLGLTNSEKSTESPKIIDKVAVAFYSCTRCEPDELDFKKGDYLGILDDNDSDWWYAMRLRDGGRGFVPSNYVKLLEIIKVSEGDKSKDCKRKVATALYSFTASESDELDLKREDYILILDDSDPTWWFAMHLTNRRKGFVPSSYVKLMEITKHSQEDKLKLSSNMEEANLKESKSEFFCWKLEKRFLPVVVGPLPDDQEDIEIQSDSLDFIYPIGKESFGEIFHGYYNKTFEVSIKYIRGIELKDFRREVLNLKKIKHPQIVRLFAFCSEPFLMVMEYMCHGNLQHYLKDGDGKELKLPSLINMASQISDGMKYLESEKLMHRNLAASNILVGKDDVVKLAEFGSEGLMDDERCNERRNLLFKWTSPETLKSGEFTIKSDVWSFGIVLYEIFTHGGTPYEGKNNDEIAQLLDQNYRMPKPEDPECSDPVYDTMLYCWKKNPEERPTFEYLYHFFMDYEETSYKTYYRIPFPIKRKGNYMNFENLHLETKSSLDNAQS